MDWTSSVVQLFCAFIHLTTSISYSLKACIISYSLKACIISYSLKACICSAFNFPELI